GRSAILANHRNNTFVDVCCAPNNKTFSITETKTLVESNDEKLVNTYDLNGETPYSMALGIGELFIGFNNTFVDVCCAPNNKTFSITETKTLVESNDEKLVNTYDLNGETPYSMVLGIGELFIGFNNGTIRCFDVQSVTHKRTYCKTHYLLCDVAMGRYVDALLSTSHPANGRLLARLSGRVEKLSSNVMGRPPRLFEEISRSFDGGRNARIAYHEVEGLANWRQPDDLFTPKLHSDRIADQGTSHHAVSMVPMDKDDEHRPNTGR
ncbi:hypothetical protein Tcan_07662, partial [Toxocara canis]